MQEGNKLKKDFSYHMIKGLLTKLEKEGIEAVYLSLKNAKISP